MHTGRKYPARFAPIRWLALPILAVLLVVMAPARADECVTPYTTQFNVCGSWSHCAGGPIESAEPAACLEHYLRFENLPPFGTHKVRMAVSVQDAAGGDPTDEEMSFRFRQLNGCDEETTPYQTFATCHESDCSTLTDYNLGVSGTTDICIQLQSGEADPDQDEAFIDHGGEGECDWNPVIVTTLPADVETLAAADFCTSPGTKEGGTNYTYTQSSNDSREILKEGLVSGKSKLRHVWRFDNVPAGSSQELLIEGKRANNTDGDNFQFGISTSASSCSSPFQVISGAVINSPTESSVNHSLGTGSLTGTVYIAVWDTVASGSHLATVEIDKIAIRTIYECP